MHTFTLDIWEGFSYQGEEEDKFRPTLDAYILKSDTPRPAVLILPGSGYRQCSPREAEPVALRFNASGCHAFVLWYSCAPRRHPVPILDCCRALTIIREQAAAWKVDSKKLAVMGFSAGGHLGLSAALFYNRDFAVAPGISAPLCRPDALMLCYPVISSGEFAHRDSFSRLLGENPAPALLELLSLEKQIKSGLPPVFLWHTYTDQAVPVENSLLLAASLRRAGVPLEMHIFPKGKHGLSLAIPETQSNDPANVDLHAAQWFSLCENWLKLMFK
ncbi:MAG: alpha/beta hydrolase [Treponema sp.]|nr:alpha/beta hydrolase [Treponema sp.]